jgi:hypothetical protein
LKELQRVKNQMRSLIKYYKYNIMAEFLKCFIGLIIVGLIVIGYIKLGEFVGKILSQNDDPENKGIE